MVTSQLSWMGECGCACLQLPQKWKDGIANITEIAASYDLNTNRYSPVHMRDAPFCAGHLYGPQVSHSLVCACQLATTLAANQVRRRIAEFCEESTFPSSALAYTRDLQPCFGWRDWTLQQQPVL